jgi:hypothetical protein
MVGEAQASVVRRLCRKFEEAVVDHERSIILGGEGRRDEVIGLAQLVIAAVEGLPQEEQGRFWRRRDAADATIAVYAPGNGTARQYSPGQQEAFRDRLLYAMGII